MSLASRIANCTACREPVPRDALSVCCCECSSLYHTGKCSGVAKKNVKVSWVCSECAMKKTSGAMINSEEPQPTLREVLAAISSVQSRLDEFHLRVDRLDKAMQLQSTKNDSVLGLAETQSKLIEKVESSMEMLSKKYDEITTNIASQSRQLAALRKHSDEIDTRLAAKDKEIAQLQTAVTNLEIYSRRNNIEIHGVKPGGNEDLNIVLKSLAEKLDIASLTADCIDAAHRLPAREGRIPPIIVKFTSRIQRDTWYSKRRILVKENIFINENLTAETRRLLWQAKQVAKAKAFKFVWTKNGMVFMRKTEGSGAKKIVSEADLLRLN